MRQCEKLVRHIRRHNLNIKSLFFSINRAVIEFRGFLTNYIFITQLYHNIHLKTIGNVKQ